jgi:hypothetical protein
MFFLQNETLKEANLRPHLNGDDSFLSPQGSRVDLRFARDPRYPSIGGCSARRIGRAVVDFTRSIAKREVTFFKGIAAMRRL